MKMKKTLTALTATAMFVTPLTALAADANWKTLESDGSIEFIPDDSVVSPVRPVYPSEPGTSGPLSIDVVPDFHFGQQLITQDTMTYWAVAQPLGEPGTDYIYEDEDGNWEDENGVRYTETSPGTNRIVLRREQDGYRSWVNMPDENETSGYITVYCGTNPGAQDPATNTVAQDPDLCTPEGYLYLTNAAGEKIPDEQGGYVVMPNIVNVYRRWMERLTDDEGNYIYGPLHAQITDRRGSQDGWNLVVRQESEFTAEIEDYANPGTYVDTVLEGARITLHGVDGMHGENGRGRRLNVERASHATDTDGVRAGVNVFDQNIVLLPGQTSQPLFWSIGGLTDADDVAANTATQTGLVRGMGTHIIDFGGDDDGSGIDGSVNAVNTFENEKSRRSTGVSLTVPGNAMNEALYTTTFTWSLANTPANNPLN